MTTDERARRPDRLLIEPPPGFERLRTRLLILGFWVLLGALETAKEVTAARLQQTPRTLSDAIVVNFPWWFFWAFGTLLVIGLACRWPLDRERTLPAVVMHAAAAVIIATLHLTFVAVLVYLGVARGSSMAGADLRVQIRFWIEGYIVLDVFVYWMVLGAYHALLYQQRYVHGALREAEARTRALRFEKAAVAARLQALQMELNPHFLFNSLNAVAGLVDDGRNDEATSVIARLAQLLRLTLHRGQERAIELERELESIELYLGMEQIRFGDRLRVDIDADGALRRALVPPMILQPLVENAVRHGVAGVAGIVRVRVSAHSEGAVLELCVEDDGPGPPTAAPALTDTAGVARTGRGLANVRERLDALYGPAASLALGPAVATGARAGARAVIRLPLQLRARAPAEPVGIA